MIHSGPALRHLLQPHWLKPPHIYSEEAGRLTMCLIVGNCFMALLILCELCLSFQ